MYEERFYRNDFSKHWHSYQVSVKETDILIQSRGKLEQEKIYALVKRYRKEIEDYINIFPGFKTSLSPFTLREPAPAIVKDMIEKSSLADVGPMASVAGAVAEYVGRELLEFTPEIIVENGGDIFIRKIGDIILGLYAGKNNFINNFLLSIKNSDSSLGICSSSSSLGHSLSLGNADLAAVISDSAVFADAMATRLANMVNDERDIEKAVKFSQKFSLLKGVVIVKRDKLGIWGDVQLLKK